VSSFNWHKLPWKWYLLALTLIVVDQITKAMASGAMQLYETKEVTSFFYLTVRHNYGAAFSMLHEGDGWQRYFLSSLAAIVSVVLIIWMARLPREKWLERCALALVLSGALGNLYDRVLLGYVVDFLVFHYQAHEWPAFNVADSAISVGAVLLIWDAFFIKGKEANKEATSND